MEHNQQTDAFDSISNLNRKIRVLLVATRLTIGGDMNVILDIASYLNSHPHFEVPLGAFLSGGIDSSIVVGLMARHMSVPVKTFSIGFVDQPVVDETAYAQVVADFNATDHHTFRLSYRDILDAIPNALSSLGKPFADYSFLPTYLVSRETRRHVTVALSGDGGDELFAGYAKYRGRCISNTISRSLPCCEKRFCVRSLKACRLDERIVWPKLRAKRGALLKALQKIRLLAISAGCVSCSRRCDNPSWV